MAPLLRRGAEARLLWGYQPGVWESPAMMPGHWQLGQWGPLSVSLSWWLGPVRAIVQWGCFICIQYIIPRGKKVFEDPCQPITLKGFFVLNEQSVGWAGAALPSPKPHQHYHQLASLGQQLGGALELALSPWGSLPTRTPSWDPGHTEKLQLHPSCPSFWQSVSKCQSVGSVQKRPCVCMWDRQ